LTRVCIWLWRVFADLDLTDARQSHFVSLQECFTRELKPGARPMDPDPTQIISPSDGIVGECGRVEGTRLFQAKGFPYSIVDLFGSEKAAAPYRDGMYVTLRLTSAMYHRFHAPAEGRIEHVTYISGDTWNVNPIALKRVERLFCRNERAVLRMRLDSGVCLAMVPVAAILVASIRLHFLNIRLHLRWRGPHELPCATRVSRGQELGWFEHGSTIILFAPAGFHLCPNIEPGHKLRMGQRLMCPDIQ
jgi:phosphatidylserine decarboxylase